MNVIKLLNNKTYESNEMYEKGDLVKVVGLKGIVYNKITNGIDIGTICKVVDIQDKYDKNCGKTYCNLSSRCQCIMIENIENKPYKYIKDRTWTCYAVVERIHKE